MLLSVECCGPLKIPQQIVNANERALEAAESSKLDHSDAWFWSTIYPRSRNNDRIQVGQVLPPIYSGASRKRELSINLLRTEPVANQRLIATD